MRYETMWRNKWITDGDKTIDDFIKTYEDIIKMFEGWKEKGVQVENHDDDYATFYTENEKVAEELGWEPEEEWEDEECDEFLD